MNDLERLRALLLEQERQRLERLETDLHENEQRVRLQRDLPHAVHQLGDNQTFRQAMEKPVTAALHTSIERDRDRVASLLFPVIGPAIRRAVQEAFRGVIQRINLALEYGLSPRAWRWRIESWRSGTPFAQIVLSHSLNFSIDELFIIHRRSGLMVARRSRREILALDQDAVASMLTAIQSFLQQSLGGVADDPLRTVELGEATLWLVNGPDVLLAAVIRGEPPISLREDLHEALEEAHHILGDRLTDYAGDPINSPAIDALLDRHLVEQQTQRKKSAATKIIWFLALITVIAGLSYWGWQQWRLSSTRQATIELVEQTPGLLLVDTRIHQGQVHGLLLRDPLAPEWAHLATRGHLDDKHLNLRIRPYLSQDPAILTQRLGLAAGLDDPRTITLNQRRIIVNQSLTPEQWRLLQRSAPLLAPQWQLEAPDFSEAGLRQMLRAPPSVQLILDEKTSGEAHLVISGMAPQSWVDQLDQQLLDSRLRLTLDASAVVGDEVQQLTELIASIDGSRLHFVNGEELTTQSSDQFNKLAQQVVTLERLGHTVGRDIKIIALGMSDGTDSWAANQLQRQGRAQLITNALINAGLSPALIRADIVPTPAPQGFNPELRYVEILVTEQ